MGRILNLKSTKGITLIALVVTIIVLLILAGVSIAMLTGENGVMSQAINAKEKTEIAGEKEAIALAYTAAVTEKKGGETVRASDMNTQFEKSGTNAEASGSIIVEFKDSHRWYKIDSLGSVTGPYSEDDVQTSKTLVEAFNAGEIKIGDYISYNPIASGDSGSEKKYSYESEESSNGYGSQVYSVNNDKEKVNWIVLGLSDDEKSLLITSGSPIRKEGTNNPTNDSPYYEICGLAGYVNAETELKSISQIYGYGDFAESARSITIEDINKLTGYNPAEDYIDGEGEIYEYGNNITIIGDGKGTYKYNGENGKSGTFTADHKQSGFQYVDDNNQLKTIPTNDTSSTVTLKQEQYYYTVNKSVIGDSIYNKIFNTGNKYYWLASQAVDVGSYRVGFDIYTINYGEITNYDLFHSDGTEFSRACAVRPVVVLKPETTVNDMPILGEQIEPKWN